MLSIKNILTLATDDKYLDAVDIEDDIVWPLNRAGYEIYDALSGIETHNGVDIPEQREYIGRQIDEMIYQLNRVKDSLEGC